jgi:hypothetical protein
MPALLRTRFATRDRQLAGLSTVSASRAISGSGASFDNSQVVSQIFQEITLKCSPAPGDGDAWQR